MSVLSERVTDLAKFYDSHSARTAADQSRFKGNNVAKYLVEIIRNNPGCVAIVDNDGWQLHRVHPNEEPEGLDGDAWDLWDSDNTLASDTDVVQLGEGYGSGNCYGGDILQALAVIVGIKIESV